MNDPTNLLDFSESGGEISISVPIDSPNPNISVIVIDVSEGPEALHELNNKLTFSFFPNPVEDGKLNIQQSGDSNLSIAIYNLNGQQLLKQNMGGKLIAIDVSALLPGVYIAKVSNGEKVLIRKIIRK